jgi:4-hydroxybenzoate polyprenyltransferase
VPALAGHVFLGQALVDLCLGFVAFCLCASSAYVLNDLFDVGNDRQDRVKRYRPFAAGLIPLRHGLLLSPLLLLAGLALGACLHPSFLAALVGYYTLTLAYSLILKRLAMLDVVALSGLYGIRMVAGAAVSGVPLSHWLAAFAMFLFLFLALIKRATELKWQRDAGRTTGNGRGYSAEDLGIIEAMAAASGFVSVMVFALYVSSIEVLQLYGHPARLWAACLVMIYWVGHLLLLTHRGRMHDDPVVFAVTDRNSLACGLVLALIVGASL